MWHFLFCIGPWKCCTASFFTTHTHTHISHHGVSLRSELIRPKTGTALPNHIAASKSSVYISNYIVACGVLEHSGRSAFHLCAESRPLPCSPYFSSLLFPSSLIYLFLSGLSLLLFQSTLCWAAVLICPAIFVLWTQHRRAKPTVGGAAGSSLMICLLSCSNLQGSTM